MAVYERQTNLPALSNSQVSKFSNSQVPSTRAESLPSISLGTVLIQSMEMMTEAIESDMDRDKLLLIGIEKIIDKQLKKHVKGGLGGNGSSAPSKEYNDYWEQKRQIEWQNHLVRLEKEEKQNRERELADRQKKTDDVISELSTFAKNPLQGVSNTIDKGVKSIFTGLGSSLGEIGDSVKGKFSKIAEPFQIIGNALAPAKKSQDALDKSAKADEENLEVNKEQKKVSDLKLGLVIAGIGAVTLAIPKIMQLAGILMQEIPHFRDNIEILTNVRIPETGEIMLEKGKIILGSAIEDVKNAFARMLQSNDKTKKMGDALAETPVKLGHKKVWTTDASKITPEQKKDIYTEFINYGITPTGDIETDIQKLNEFYETETAFYENRAEAFRDAMNQVGVRSPKYAEYQKEYFDAIDKNTRLQEKKKSTIGKFLDYSWERMSPAEVGQEIREKYAAKEGELIQNKIMEKAEAGTLSKGELHYWNRNMRIANRARGIDTQTLSPEEFESQIKQISGFESFQWAPDTKYEFWEQRGKDYSQAWKDLTLNLAADLFTGTPNTGSALTSGM